MATPLEEQIGGVDNMNYMYSVNSSSGQTQITVDFDVTTDPNIDQVLTRSCARRKPSRNCAARVNTSGLIVQKSPVGPVDARFAVFAERQLR